MADLCVVSGAKKIFREEERSTDRIKISLEYKLEYPESQGADQ